MKHQGETDADHNHGRHDRTALQCKAPWFDSSASTRHESALSACQLHQAVFLRFYGLSQADLGFVTTGDPARGIHEQTVARQRLFLLVASRIRSPSTSG